MTHRLVGLLSLLALSLLVPGCLGPARIDLTPRTGGSAALVGQFAAYDGHSGRRLSFADVVARCQQADVVLFGEEHNDVVCNELEAQLLYALVRQPRPMALAMEFFEADTQAALDAYLRGRIGEAPFREETHQGRAYVLSHRPLIELCRMTKVPVIAANAPRRLVRAYRMSGLSYEGFRAGLAPGEQRWLPNENTFIAGGYEERFLEIMQSHGGPAPTTQPTTAPTTQPITAETAPPPGMPPMPPGMPRMPPPAMPATVPSPEPPSTMPTTAVPPSEPAGMPRMDPAAMYEAQLLWDQTMAESLATCRARYPTHRVMLIVGSFHVTHDGGTAIKFRQLRPLDQVITIVYRGMPSSQPPFEEEDRGAGDIVIYGIKPPPEPEREAPASAPATQPAETPTSQPATTEPAIPQPATAAAAVRQASAAPQREIPIRDVLVIGGVGHWARSAVHTDAIEAEIIAGRWSPPVAGQTVTLPDGLTKTWTAVSADEQGLIHDAALEGGYVYAVVESEREEVLLLEASGHSMVYANGEPRGGDPYQWGFVRIPVVMKVGSNHFLFACGRGELRAKLVEPRAPLMLDTADATVPDLLRNTWQTAWGSVPVANATTAPQRNLTIRAAYRGQMWVSPALPDIPPLGVRKIAFGLPAPPGDTPSEVEVTLGLYSPARPENEGLLDQQVLKLAVRAPSERHKRTFVSEIDGSVQYYAVVPAGSSQGVTEAPALVLTLHGAGVEATGQAAAYSAKTWAHIVAPTNRRPYGFDWEDWGRLDALEVLADAQTLLGSDPQRTYLTGHSMGGHGTWQVGVQYPDRFAAIAPSAGWISFWSYVGAERPGPNTPVETILRRATDPSDTLALSDNYAHFGVYVLHGDQDDIVPVEQARAMRARLGEFHPNFAYYERPGAGHWWGNECVDWPPLFEFLRQNTRPEPGTVRHIQFVTANPAISATCDWATIEAQTRCLDLSRIDLHADPNEPLIKGTTDNVARLALIDPHGRDGRTLTLDLDGDHLESATGAALRLARQDDHWQIIATPPDPYLKGPQRGGPFKEAFRHRVQFVYGTRGTPEENTWQQVKARYDAEVFWVRGNGSVDVLADEDFDPSAEPDRSVLLYGHAESNGAWKALLADCPLQVTHGRVQVGKRSIEGRDLAVLAVYPRPGSDRALVGVVSGTGPAGLRLTERLPYFVSGVAYPDWIVIGPEMLESGASGVRAAGCFGNDWQVDPEQSGWQDG
jgi:uncharacterized iron-regulated protein/dienelactone hydrolase